MISEKDCKHEMIFRESIPRNSSWFCRMCFKEMSKESLVMYDARSFKVRRKNV